jgi:hypothetical protein
MADATNAELADAAMALQAALNAPEEPDTELPPPPVFDDEGEPQPIKSSGRAPASRPILVKDVYQVARPTKSIEPDRDWREFAKYLRFARQQKTTPGIARDSGGRIVKNRLARILTDGKVLAYRDLSRLLRGKPEVILVIDASGSMQNARGAGESLFDRVTRAAEGMFESLMGAGIPTAVYAHTSWSSPGRGDDPLLVQVAAFRMPMFTTQPLTHGDYAQRFNALTGIRTSQNYDGYILEKVADQFTDVPGTKLLVMLSDGTPMGGGYHGDTADKHTQDAAIAARRKGVHVLSVSLVAGVVKANDKIYGSRYNLSGYGDSLNPTLQDLAMTLVAAPDRD